MNEVDKYLFLDCVCGMRVLEEAGLAAADVECMNCSVRSFDSFMFCSNMSLPNVHLRCIIAHLCSNLQNILEGHTRVRELTLEKHNDVVIVFVNKLALDSL